MIDLVEFHGEGVATRRIFKFADITAVKWPLEPTILGELGRNLF